MKKNLLQISVPLSVHYINMWLNGRPVPPEFEHVITYLNNCSEKEFHSIRRYYLDVCPGLKLEHFARIMTHRPPE